LPSIFLIHNYGEPTEFEWKKWLNEDYSEKAISDLSDCEYYTRSGILNTRMRGYFHVVNSLCDCYRY